MLERLGFKHFAYDWRGEHIPTFDAEIEALKRHGVSLDAFWVAPGELNDESRIILDVLKRHGVKAPALGPARLRRRPRRRAPSKSAASTRPSESSSRWPTRPPRSAARVALYNHGGWFGEPENQIAIIEELKAQGITNVGMVYNLHHGHEHLDRFPELLANAQALPRGAQPQRHGPRRRQATGGRSSRWARATHDLELLRTIRDSGYRWPDRHPRPHPGRRRGNGSTTTSTASTGSSRSSKADPPARAQAPHARARPVPHPKDRRGLLTRSRHQVDALARRRPRAHGDPRAGRAVLRRRRSSPACPATRSATEGGSSAPTSDDRRRLPLARARSSSRSSGRRGRSRKVIEAIAIATDDGQRRSGIPAGRTERGDRRSATPPRRAASGSPQGDDRGRPQTVGTLMPEGLAASMSPVRAPRSRPVPARPRPARQYASARSPAAHAHAAGAVSPTTGRRSIPRAGRTGKHPVNRERIYDFYAQGGRLLPRRSRPSRCSCRRFPASTAARTATGATRTRTPGPTAAGTRPTWAPSSAASSGAPA